MTCSELHEHVSDLVEGTTDASLREAVDAHLASCDSCRALVADLSRIRQTASALERQPVPPGAWGRIARRLETEPGFQRASARGTRDRGLSWAWLAAAAALVLAVSAGVWNLGRTLPPAADTAGRPETIGAAPAQNLVESIENELQLAAGHYENAIAGLERIAAASDSPLDPVLMATVKENLAVIDRAIDESRVALRANPESQVAQENLFEAFRRKIGLLQDTIALMNEMRKGDEAGAARIVEGLNKS